MSTDERSAWPLESDRTCGGWTRQSLPASGRRAPREAGETGLGPKAEHPVSPIPDPKAPWQTPANSQITQTVRAGIECEDTTGCVVPPLHLTSTFAFRAFGEKRTYDYTRSGNPTRDLLAGALAELEQGSGAVVTASGMAAITVVGYLVHAGARIIVPHDCYGGTYRLFNAWHRRGERQVEFVEFGDEAALADALSRPAALVWIETPSNPLLR